MFLSIIAQFGLLFSQPITYAIVALLGFLTYKPKWFAHALLLLFFTMVYNALLKSIWQIPLPIYLEGWAFPSGHMHSAVVFWGVIAIHARNFIIWALTLFTLLLCGYGLLYEGFHTPIDVLAAYGFGALTLVIYYGLLKLHFINEKIYRIGLITVPLALLCYVLLPEIISMKPHLFQALGGSMGLTLGCALCQNDQRDSSKTMLLKILIAVVGILCTYKGIDFLPIAKNIKIGAQFFSMTLWLALSRCLIPDQHFKKAPAQA